MALRVVLLDHGPEPLHYDIPFTKIVVKNPMTVLRALREQHSKACRSCPYRKTEFERALYLPNGPVSYPYPDSSRTWARLTEVDSRLTVRLKAIQLSPTLQSYAVNVVVRYQPKQTRQRLYTSDKIATATEYQALPAVGTSSVTAIHVQRDGEKGRKLHSDGYLRMLFEPGSLDVPCDESVSRTATNFTVFGSPSPAARSRFVSAILLWSGDSLQARSLRQALKVDIDDSLAVTHVLFDFAEYTWPVNRADRFSERFAQLLWAQASQFLSVHHPQLFLSPTESAKTIISSLISLLPERSIRVIGHNVHALFDDVVLADTCAGTKHPQLDTMSTCFVNLFLNPLQETRRDGTAVRVLLTGNEAWSALPQSKVWCDANNASNDSQSASAHGYTKQETVHLAKLLLDAKSTALGGMIGSLSTGDVDQVCPSRSDEVRYQGDQVMDSLARSQSNYEQKKEEIWVPHNQRTESSSSLSSAVAALGDWILRGDDDALLSSLIVLDTLSRGEYIQASRSALADDSSSFPSSGMTGVVEKHRLVTALANLHLLKVVGPLSVEHLTYASAGPHSSDVLSRLAVSLYPKIRSRQTSCFPPDITANSFYNLDPAQLARLTVDIVEHLYDGVPIADLPPKERIFHNDLVRLYRRILRSLGLPEFFVQQEVLSFRINSRGYADIWIWDPRTRSLHVIELKNMPFLDMFRSMLNHDKEMEHSFGMAKNKEPYLEAFRDRLRASQMPAGCYQPPQRTPQPGSVPIAPADMTCWMKREKDLSMRNLWDRKRELEEYEETAAECLRGSDEQADSYIEPIVNRRTLDDRVAWVEDGETTRIYRMSALLLGGTRCCAKQGEPQVVTGYPSFSGVSSLAPDNEAALERITADNDGKVVFTTSTASEN